MTAIRTHGVTQLDLFGPGCSRVSMSFITFQLSCLSTWSCARASKKSWFWGLTRGQPGLQIRKVKVRYMYMYSLY